MRHSEAVLTPVSSPWQGSRPMEKSSHDQQERRVLRWSLGWSSDTGQGSYWHGKPPGSRGRLEEPHYSQKQVF